MSFVDICIPAGTKVSFALAASKGQEDQQTCTFMILLEFLPNERMHVTLNLSYGFNYQGKIKAAEAYLPYLDFEGTVITCLTRLFYALDYFEVTYDSHELFIECTLMYCELYLQKAVKFANDPSFFPCTNFTSNPKDGRLTQTTVDKVRNFIAFTLNRKLYDTSPNSVDKNVSKELMTSMIKKQRVPSNFTMYIPK